MDSVRGASKQDISSSAPISEPGGGTLFESLVKNGELDFAKVHVS